ncbi:MAG: signal peptidase II [Erysipelotrichaceae bacterium]|nr:signal peptidase II [Erysipelotrichaceae bacterium]
MTYVIYSFIVVALTAIDQYLKNLVTTYIPLKESITVIDGFFNLTYVQNFGAGFSIMQNATTTFYILTPICLAIFLYLLKTCDKRDYLTKSALLLMIGGTMGNFLDRIFRIYVVDFLDFNLLGWDFPVFNFADICLTVGVALFIITVLKENKNAKA